MKNYLETTGQLGEEGQKLSTNSDSSGRYHSDWLNMMYPRLKLARNLLTDDGVIFISIDDNEVTNLRKICDEIFGENNFIGNIVWQSRTSISNDDYISNNHNHTLIYSKLNEKLEFGGEDLDKDEYINPDNDVRGPWKLVPIDANHVGGDTVYGIINPKTGVEYFPPNGRIWAYNKLKYQELFNEGRIKFGINDDSSPKKKLYLNERIKNGDRKTPSSILINAGTTKDGTKEIMELFSNKKIFDYPKPTDLIKRLIKYSSKNNNGLILDFFSGSATTAHAVMQLNAEDGGNRKYIMVQLPELCDEKSEAYKAGYRNICEIGKERIRRAGEKIKEELEKENSQLKLGEESKKLPDIGFKVFKLDSSNIKEWDSETEDLRQSLFDSVDNIKSDRTSLDVLYEIILKYGLELTVPIEERENFYSIGGGTLLINLDKEIDMEIIDSICEEYKNLLEIDEEFKTTVILRDSAFKNDIDKTNAMKKLEQVGIREVRSI